MGISISDLFAASALKAAGPVRFYGERPPSGESGVYVVTTTPDPTVTTSAGPFPARREAFRNLLETRPELTCFGTRPSIDDLVAAVARWWIRDERVVYIGATSAKAGIAGRVGDFYRTPLGARRPHAGGMWVHLIDAPLWVFWAGMRAADRAEADMVAAFRDSALGRPDDLADPHFVMPFANLEWPKGIRKPHGVEHQREPRS